MGTPRGVEMARYESGSLVNWYRSKMRPVEAGVDDAMDEAGGIGKELGRHYIETRGTQRMWLYPRNGRDGSYPGRVDTGKMRDAFGFRKTTQGGSRQLRVGWVSGTREDYFKYQEGGFEHPSGLQVEGMYAVQDATEEAFRVLAEELKKRVKSV